MKLALKLIDFIVDFMFTAIFTLGFQNRSMAESNSLADLHTPGTMVSYHIAVNLLNILPLSHCKIPSAMPFVVYCFIGQN